MSIIRLVHVRAFGRTENTAVELDPGARAAVPDPDRSLVGTSSQCFLIVHSPQWKRGALLDLGSWRNR